MRTSWLTLAIVLLIACDETPTRPSDLVGETRRLVSIERIGAAAIAVPDPARYTLQFLDGGRVSVRADCNTCGGSYVLAGTALSIGTLACTRAFCGAASLDGVLTQALGQARALARVGPVLTIRGDSAVLRFRND